MDTEAISGLKQSTGKDEIFAAGIIANLRVLKSKKGDLYAQGTLEDMVGAVDILVFPEAYRRLQDNVKLKAPVLVRGTGRVEEGPNPKLTLGDINPPQTPQHKPPPSLRLTITTTR